MEVKPKIALAKYYLSFTVGVLKLDFRKKHLFGKCFPENCIKIKEIGLRGNPFDPPIKVQIILNKFICRMNGIR